MEDGRSTPAQMISSFDDLQFMDRKLGADCPCGFTFTTPHGEDDAVAILQLHLRRVHGKSNPTKEEAKSAIKAR